METLITQSQFRTDTLDNWNRNNPVLKVSEPAIAINGKDLIFKIGDGQSKWKDLPERGTGGESISDVSDDGKLYGRTRNVDAAGGYWQEIVLPEVDTRKNFNDVVQANYDEVIDMGFTVNVNDVEKEVYGVKKKVTGINLDTTVQDKNITVLADVYSLIDVRGTFCCGHNDIYTLNSYNPECYTYARLDSQADQLYLGVVRTSDEAIFNAYAEMYIMYTKVAE